MSDRDAEEIKKEISPWLQMSSETLLKIYFFYTFLFFNYS